MTNFTTNNNDNGQPDNIDTNADKTHTPNSGKPSRKENDVANLDLFATSDAANRDVHPAETVTGYVSGNNSRSENTGLFEDVTAAASIFSNSNDLSPPITASDENHRSPEISLKNGSSQITNIGTNGDTPGDKYMFTASYKNSRTANGEHQTTGEFHVQLAKKEQSSASKRTEKSRRKYAKSGWIRAEFKLRAELRAPLSEIVKIMNAAAVKGESFYPRLAEIIQRFEEAS